MIQLQVVMVPVIAPVQKKTHQGIIRPIIVPHVNVIILIHATTPAQTIVMGLPKTIAVLVTLRMARVMTPALKNPMVLQEMHAWLATQTLLEMSHATQYVLLTPLLYMILVVNCLTALNAVLIAAHILVGLAVMVVVGHVYVTEFAHLASAHSNFIK